MREDVCHTKVVLCIVESSPKFAGVGTRWDRDFSTSWENLSDRTFESMRK